LIHIFKRKPFLQDLICDDYIDIHSHLLPAIDDGSKTIEETINLINTLEEIGFKKFITTPHVMAEVWNNSKLEIEEKCSQTIAKITVPKIETRFKAAAEYMIDSEFSALFKKETLLTIKENYVLVEMSYLNPPFQLHETLNDLQTAGYQPILAHPERYNFYQSRLEEYKKLKDIGCLFQLNLLSTVGYYGPKVAKTTELLLKNGLIDFVGSDVHHKKHVESLKRRIIVNHHNSLTALFKNNSIFDF
jgi:tyrosine-protein phosphatase YwqE